MFTRTVLGNRNRPVRSKQRLAAGVSKKGDCP